MHKCTFYFKTISINLVQTKKKTGQSAEVVEYTDRISAKSEAPPNQQVSLIWL